MEPHRISEILRRQKMIVLYIVVIALFAIGTLAPLWEGGDR